MTLPDFKPNHNLSLPPAYTVISSNHQNSQLKDLFSNDQREKQVLNECFLL